MMIKPERIKRPLKSVSFRHKIVLIAVMLSIGCFTMFAVANTYEVIAERDVPLSSTVKTINLTQSATFNSTLIDDNAAKIDPGNFGVPGKIKFPETDRHIDIIAAKFGSNGWLATQGMAQRIVTKPARQKIFGQAVIYLRFNTATTKKIGEVIPGDILNVVTDTGWQLGYEVRQVNADPAALNQDNQSSKSQIVVIMRNELNGQHESFIASLVKVGERL